MPKNPPQSNKSYVQILQIKERLDALESNPLKEQIADLECRLTELSVHVNAIRECTQKLVEYVEAAEGLNE